MNRSIRQRGKPNLRWLVGVLLALLSSAPIARAALQTLPHWINFGGYGSTLSLDGKVVILTNANFDKLYRWTQAGGAQQFAQPSNGIGWNSEQVTPNFDGSVIVGGGYLSTGDWKSSVESAWTWEVGVKIGDYVRRNFDSVYLGIAPSGSYRVRKEVDDFGNGVINRVYTSGVVSPWISLTSKDDVVRVSADTTVLVGNSMYGSSTTSLPTYWTAAGTKIQATSLLGQHPCLALYASKDGRIILGRMDFIDSNGLGGTYAFIWNTTTSQITVYLPSGWEQTFPYYLSPDGKIIEFDESATNVTHQMVVVDSTTPADAAKGPQSVASWLVAKNYVAPGDVDNRTFFIQGLSEDQTTVVGNFTNTATMATHGFIAHHP